MTLHQKLGLAATDALAVLGAHGGLCKCSSCVRPQVKSLGYQATLKLGYSPGEALKGHECTKCHNAGRVVWLHKEGSEDVFQCKLCGKEYRREA